MEQLGAGGMGEVYRAHDRDLDRDVAIKILSADDATSLARFRREAKLLAAINHPNIATVHGVHTSPDGPYLVMEVVEGNTLTDRLDEGPIPVEEALRICAQIARGVEAAHTQGIVHRDLKPANVVVLADGRVKVLDFGIAKTLAASAPPESDAPTAMATVSPELTAVGAVVGTAPYMSPEQVRGQPVDERCDIWGFGCILYELLTGQRAFGAETPADTLSAVLEHEPDWMALPSAVPEAIRKLVGRCLHKEPDLRLHSMADARVELEEAVAQGRLPRTAPVFALEWRWVAAGFVGVVMLVFVVLLKPWVARDSPQQTAVSTFQLSLDQPVAVGRAVVAISPDGSLIAYTGQEETGGRRLWLQRLGEATSWAVPGSEDADNPFFSPDGRWVGFDARGKLWRAPLAGGRPLSICDVGTVSGASWGPDDRIVVAARLGAGLFAVPASGGDLEPLTEVAVGESVHKHPRHTPEGNQLIYTVDWGSNDQEDFTTVLLDLESGATTTLLERGGSDARYVAPGYLMYGLNGTVYAAPVDLDGGKLLSDPVAVLDRVDTSVRGSGRVEAAVAANGTLVYLPSSTRDDSLVITDLHGRTKTLPGIDAGQHLAVPRFSPDGRWISYTSVDGPRLVPWLYDRQREAASRVPDTDGVAVVSNEWAPDSSRQVGFSFGGAAGFDLWTVPVAQPRQAEPLLVVDGQAQLPVDWSSDGRWVVYRSQASTGFDLWALEAGAGADPVQLTATDGVSEMQADVSPNGRWLAYTLCEDGCVVYVAPFLRPGPGMRISPGLGGGPVWSPDGGQLLYESDGQLRSLEVDSDDGSELHFGDQRNLFAVRPDEAQRAFDMSVDGTEFVYVDGRDYSGQQNRLTVILDWVASLGELRRR